MDGRADRRMVGWGVSGLVAVAAAASLLTAHPSSRPTADVHAEYVTYESGGATITAYLAYPERADPAPAVVVIHEIFGLSDFIREVTERLARDGFVALAPDLLSRRGGTRAAGDDARRLISSLPGDSVTMDLDASVAYLRGLRAVRAERIGAIGFCWGGGQSFRYAIENSSLGAYVVCYGPGPDTADVARIRAAGLGVYAEHDARINTELPEVARALQAAGKDFRYAIYAGTGHGFLRTRDNPAAADSAWGAIAEFFRRELSDR